MSPATQKTRLVLVHLLPVALATASSAGPAPSEDALEMFGDFTTLVQVGRLSAWPAPEAPALGDELEEARLLARADAAPAALKAHLLSRAAAAQAAPKVQLGAGTTTAPAAPKANLAGADPRQAQPRAGAAAAPAVPGPTTVQPRAGAAAAPAVPKVRTLAGTSITPAVPKADDNGALPLQVHPGAGIYAASVPTATKADNDAALVWQGVYMDPFAESSTGDDIFSARHLLLISLGVVLFLLILPLLQRRPPEEGKGDDLIRDVLNRAVELRSGVLQQELEADFLRPPPEVIEMPPPMRRLRSIGASYVVPRERITRCPLETLSFNVPALPSVWPLRALLVRTSPSHPWSRLHVTVESDEASGMPPVLTCTRTDAVAQAEESGGTGGTGSSTAETAYGMGLNPWDGPQPLEESLPWLKVTNAAGTVVATVRRRRDGSCLIEGQDRSIMEMAISLDGAAPEITITREGEEVSQATSLGGGSEENMQVDTEPEVQSPDSYTLLTCTIAALAFQL